MMKRRWTGILAASLMLTGAASVRAAELKAGDVAPPFSMEGSDGKTHTLAELQGKIVVVAWFPKAFTGG